MTPQETELKFKLSPQELERLRSHPLIADADVEGAAADAEPLVSTYYDTADLALRAAGVSLRIRESGERRIQTVKTLTGDGLFGRGEWEQDVDGDGLDLDAAMRTPLGAVLDGQGADALRPLFATHVRRLSRTLQYGGAEIEVSLDQGDVEGGDRSQPLNELELELKSGDSSALFELARVFGEAGPLQLSFVSKSETGYGLQALHDRAVFKAETPDINRDQTAAEAFQAIGRACLSQLTRNETAVLGVRTPEALHQMRVALRRLRAAMVTFRDVLADERRAAVADELKWIAGELNDARNLDVFIHETFEPAAAGPDVDRMAMAEFGRALLSAQDTAYDRAQRAIGSGRYRTLVLDAAGWMETGPWISSMGGVNAGLRDQPVAIFAADALTHRRRAMRKRAGALAGHDAEARHKLRIAAKKMRYAAEFFSPLYDEGRACKRRDDFIDVLKALQDDLGVLNDFATAAETVALALEPVEGQAPSVQAAFTAGVVVAARTAATPDLLHRAVKNYRRFDKAKRFW